MEPDADDVAQIGYVKIRKREEKRFKKRWAVLLQSSASLELYESDRKWKSGDKPKQTIALRPLFGVSAKLEPKFKFAVGLMGVTSFSLALETAEEQIDWLLKLRWMHQGERPPDGASKTQYERMWDVTVTNRGLGSSRKLTGQYCVGLTTDSIQLISRDNPDQLCDLPFITIRGCRHMDCFFCVEVGRSSDLGAGEIFMLLEERIYAQNMHEVIKSKFSRHTNSSESSVTAGGGDQRPRATSTSEPRRPAPMASALTAGDGVDAAIDEAEMALGRTPTRLRCDSLPSRSRLPSDAHKQRMVLVPPASRTGSSISASVDSKSSLSTIDDVMMLPPEQRGCGSMLSVDVDESDWRNAYALGQSARSARAAGDDPDYVPILGSPSSHPSSEPVDSYMVMSPMASPPMSGRQQWQQDDYMVMEPSNAESSPADGYMVMERSNAESSPADGYMVMEPSNAESSPVGGYMFMGSSKNSSPAASTVSQPAVYRTAMPAGSQPIPIQQQRSPAAVQTSDSMRSRASSLGSRLSQSLLRRRSDRKTDPTASRGSPKLSTSWDSTFSSLLPAYYRRRHKLQHQQLSETGVEPESRPRSFSQTAGRVTASSGLGQRKMTFSGRPSGGGLTPVSAAPLQSGGDYFSMAPLATCLPSNVRLERRHTTEEADYLNMEPSPRGPGFVLPGAGLSPGSSSSRQMLSGADSGDYLNMAPSSPNTPSSSMGDYLPMDMSVRAPAVVSPVGLPPLDEMSAGGSDYLEMSIGRSAGSVRRCQSARVPTSKPAVLGAVRPGLPGRRSTPSPVDVTDSPFSAAGAAVSADVSPQLGKSSHTAFESDPARPDSVVSVGGSGRFDLSAASPSPTDDVFGVSTGPREGPDKRASSLSGADVVPANSSARKYSSPGESRLIRRLEALSPRNLFGPRRKEPQQPRASPTNSVGEEGGGWTRGSGGSGRSDTSGSQRTLHSSGGSHKSDRAETPPVALATSRSVTSFSGSAAVPVTASVPLRQRHESNPPPGSHEAAARLPHPSTGSLTALTSADHGPVASQSLTALVNQQPPKQQQLVYAALDLTSRGDQANPPPERGQQLTYAKIDFKKSEATKRDASP